MGMPSDAKPSMWHACAQAQRSRLFPQGAPSLGGVVYPILLHALQRCQELSTAEATNSWRCVDPVLLQAATPFSEASKNRYASIRAQPLFQGATLAEHWHAARMSDKSLMYTISDAKPAQTYDVSMPRVWGSK